MTTVRIITGIGTVQNVAYAGGGIIRMGLCPARIVDTPKPSGHLTCDLSVGACTPCAVADVSIQENR